MRPVTSVLSCWTGLWIKPPSCYFCSLLLNRSVDQTTVLSLPFSAFELVCGSNYCLVTSVLCCWNCPCLEQISCYAVTISSCTPPLGVPSNLTGSDWRSQQGRRLAHCWHRPSDRDTKTTTQPVARYRRLCGHSDWGARWMVRDANPGRGERFLSSPKLPDRLWGPPSLPFIW